jgi:hypothetical protein
MKELKSKKEEEASVARLQRSVLLVTLLLCSAPPFLPSARVALPERGRVLSERPLGSSSVTVQDSGVRAVTFEMLGAATLPDDQGWQNTTIPPEVLELSGTPVALQGYMIPLTFQRTKVTSFLLVKDQASCCLGVGATMKDWVFVKMTHPTPSVMNIPLEVQGTFYASPDVVDGQLLILYRMSGESVVRKD